MKELSIEEKAKAYDDAINAIKKLKAKHPTAHVIKDWIKENFPELAESEDERIRKGLIQYFSTFTLDTFAGLEPKKILAWLEKQGKKTKPIEGFNTEFERQVSCLIASAMNKDYEYTKDFVKWTSEGLLNYAKREFEKNSMGISEATKKKLEDNLNKALEKETPESFNKFLDEQGEQKPDKIEPKFEIEEGKWYVCIRDLFDNYANKAFRKDDIYLSTQNGSLIPSNSNVPFEVVCPDTYFKDWTIQDAKNGDVLVNWNNNIYLFKGIEEEVVKFYCYYSTNHEEFNIPFNNNSYLGLTEPQFKHHPATKEQRDLLFQKMKEAGYEWNDEKKELKKIGQKPANWLQELEDKLANATPQQLAEWKEKYFKEEPTEWSEEDENILNTIINHFKVDIECTDEDDIVRWLKSLKDRVQQQNITVTDEELAQAKKEAYNDALDKIEYHSGEPTFDDGWGAAIWYLKKRNTIPQSQWKPSDEQMLAINTAINVLGKGTINGKYLIELHEQLKKLREE
jgi:hypothetical protein